MVSTLNDLTSALREGRSTSVALTEAALARAQDPAGEGARAFTKLYADSALAQARASDTLRAAGIVRSAIEGLPISIKDLFDIAGETTMAGSVAREGEPAAEANAEVVQRLIAAGAVIIGRTNMTEFAYSGLGINPHYGTPLNPYDRATGRIPGGSSSGAAVSVADGMAVAGIGSDTGGSVRIPAALCGLTGFKPSAWRVSMQGVLPLSANLDSIGPIAASVRCCAELDAILSGDAGPLPQALPVRGLRLAIPTTLALDAMDKHVSDTFAAAVQRLEDAGALIDRIEIPEFAELAAINSKGGFTAAEAWAWHRDLIARAGKRYDPRVVSRIMRGQDMTAADYIELLDAREAWVAAVDHRIAGYDALIMPTTPIVAPPVADLQGSDEAYYAANGLILRNPTLINFLDGCALSLPCHAAGTAPVGLMIAASNGADRRVLGIGLSVEDLFVAR
ncbi:2-amino-5-chloromuconic acid deaminase [Achromobacter animicus]|uniref:2-amino-5-chloromuconic acid deaminase n=1 Tax=Achromobacter animicus TaxID=1389935 RepID=A0A6S6Z6D6_9BURK|nr:amidase [Achromobacter animicus]CAB3662806.1 2-amino-5-chloromuconic acid deaminase [Achromobacter animicus]